MASHKKHLNGSILELREGVLSITQQQKTKPYISMVSDVIKTNFCYTMSFCLNILQYTL